MTVITNTWRQLVQRRLWPVAVLLVGALAAVPVLLAKQPQASPAAPVASGGHDDGGELASAPIVTEAGDSSTGRRHVLGNAKNPFAVKAKPPSVSSSTSAAPGGSVTPTTVSTSPSSDARSLSSQVKLPSSTSSAPSLSSGSPAGSSTGSTGGTPTTGVAPKTAPKPRYPLYSIDVRFGDTSTDQMDSQTVKRLEPLPDADTPVVIYLGVKNDGKTAVFLLDDGVTAEGDGSCKPRGNDCETVELRAGDTEFLDVPATAGGQAQQYELDLVKIHRKTTSSAARAKRARAASSAAGRKLLRARASHEQLPFHYDAATGTVHDVRKLADAAVHALMRVAVAHL